MSISDKTRKVLWAHSANRCAICHTELVVAAAGTDPVSVVGEECHIHARSPGGPRFDASLSREAVDDLANLVLLCAVHHKMVDDQVETYTAGKLRDIKVKHEQWIKERLEQPGAPRIRRNAKDVPTKLDLILNGRQLFQLASGCHAAYNDYESDLSDEEADLVSGLLDDLIDWVGFTHDMGVGSAMKVERDLGEQIDRLAQAGFLVFAAKEKQRLEGGVGLPSNFFVLHISVVRATSPRIVPVSNPEELKSSE